MKSKTRRMADEMNKMRMSGMSMPVIGRHLGVSRQRVDQLLHGCKIKRRCAVCGQAFVTTKVLENTCGRLCGITRTISPPTAGGCWEWSGYRRKGYGNLRFKGRQMAAHRWMWEIVYGHIPNGLCVLHRCDNPPCVNPYHLWLGTHLDNMQDRDAKGRCNHLRLFSDEQARAIRKKHADGMSYAAISREYNTALMTIKRIATRATYKSVR